MEIFCTQNTLDPYTFYTRFLQKYCFLSEKFEKAKTYKSIENKGFYQILTK